MNRLLLSLLSITLLASPAFAQVNDNDLKDWEQLFELMQRKDDVGKRAQMGWLEFSQRKHTKDEQAKLIALWHKHKDEFSRKAVLYGGRLDQFPALNKIREEQIQKPQSDDILALSLEGYGYHAKHTDSPKLVAYFEHKNVKVQISAVGAFLTILERFEGQPIGEGLRPGHRAPAIFKNFKPYLQTLLQSKVGTLRSGALRGLVMLSANKDELPLKFIQSAVNDDHFEVRYCLARIAQKNPNLSLSAELIVLLADSHEPTACFANLALEQRLSNKRVRSDREKTLEQLKQDLDRDDSCVKQAPHILRRLGDIYAAKNDAKSALKYYRAAGLSSAKGALEPPHFMYHAGATARVQAALLLIKEGRAKEAKLEIVKAHIDFHPEVDIQLPGQGKKTLHLVLKKTAKLVGGVNFPPKPVTGPPPRKYGRVAVPRANPGMAPKPKSSSRPSSQPSSRPSSKPTASKPSKK